MWNCYATYNISVPLNFMQNNRTNDKKHENQKKNLYYVLEKKKAMYEVDISKVLG